jgi:transposase
MIQLAPQLKILLAYEPVDFRKGIDALVAVCRERLQEDPFSGRVFVFRNRAGTAVKLLAYDGGGYWLCLKRFSQGRLRWWPALTGEPLTLLAAQRLHVLLYQGNPESAQLAEPWRRLTA